MLEPLRAPLLTRPLDGEPDGLQIPRPYELLGQKVFKDTRARVYTVAVRDSKCFEF